MFDAILILAAPCVFLGLCKMMAIGGWSILSKARSETSPPTQAPLYQAFWLSAALSGESGMSKYSNCLWLQIYPDGMRLGLLKPFSFGHPILWIPRSAIQDGSLGSWGRLGTTYKFSLDGITLRLAGKAAIQVKHWVENEPAP